MLLYKFLPRSKAELDGAVALIKIGAGGSIDMTDVKDPIIFFVLD